MEKLLDHPYIHIILLMIKQVDSGFFSIAAVVSLTTNVMQRIEIIPTKMISRNDMRNSANYSRDFRYCACDLNTFIGDDSLTR